MTTLTQAMATTFRVATQSGEVIDVAGRNMGDKMLEKYAASDNADAAAVARVLLDESYVTYEVIDGAKRVVRVPHPTPPDDDGFGPLGVTTPAPAKPAAMPKAVVPQPQQKPAPAPWDAETPEWAKALQRSMDKLIHDFSRFEVLFDVAERMAKAPAQTHAPGVGQGGGSGGASQFFYVTRAVIEHKEGKVYINFWNDDNENLQFAEIYAAKSAKDWQKLLPWVNPAYFQQMSDKDWFKAFPELDKVGQFPCRCNVYYTLSSKLNKKGNPFKDIQRIEKL